MGSAAEDTPKRAWLRRLRQCKVRPSKGSGPACLMSGCAEQIADGTRGSFAFLWPVHNRGGLACGSLASRQSALSPPSSTVHLPLGCSVASGRRGRGNRGAVAAANLLRRLMNVSTRARFPRAAEWPRSRGTRWSPAAASQRGPSSRFVAAALHSATLADPAASQSFASWGD